MKLPRRQMMNARAEFQRVKSQGSSKVGKYMILSSLPCSELKESKFAFITSKRVGKAHQRNLVRRRFKDLISRHGEKLSETRYVVMIGRYSTPEADFSAIESEFLRLSKKIGLFTPVE